ncbi:MAG: GyrI-like domain-containing protein [Clostridia bacterium]|nr:GyrI-like domain-containing protein [Clostridia bacterium]
MQMNKCVMGPFVVIGKEGSTSDGPGFIERLWADANAHFDQVQHLAKRDEDGKLLGVWGAMSDFSRSFMPWENQFSQGLYLAGVECREDAQPPAGWTKWVIPGYEYVYTEAEEEDTFAKMLALLAQEGLELAGAVHDFHCPQTGKQFMFFPIRKI